MLVLEQGEGLWGAQQVVLRLAPLLDERGLEQVLAAPGAGPLAAAWRGSGRRHVDVPAPRTRGIRGSSGRLSVWKLTREMARTTVSILRIAKTIRRVRADVVLANNHWSHVEGVVAARLVRRPIVLHLHTQSKADALGRLRGLAVLAATRAVAVSEAIRKALPRRARGRVDVVRNGIDVARYARGRGGGRLRRELGVDADTPIVLSLSRYEADKGLDELIRAVSMLPGDLAAVRVVLAGGSRENTSHADYLGRLGSELLGDRVRFLGFREDILELLGAADVCVLPSHDEGLPLVVLEAQAAGCPLVASNAGGIPEIVEHGVTGLLFPVGDVASLATELERLLTDAALRDHLRSEARRQVAVSGTLDRQADALAEILRSVVRD